MPLAKVAGIGEPRCEGGRISHGSLHDRMGHPGVIGGQPRYPTIPRQGQDEERAGLSMSRAVNVGGQIPPISILLELRTARTDRGIQWQPTLTERALKLLVIR